jgi:hypothetical protein
LAKRIESLSEWVGEYFFVDVVEGVLVAVVGEADVAEELFHGLGHRYLVYLFVGLHGKRRTDQWRDPTKRGSSPANTEYLREYR